MSGRLPYASATRSETACLKVLSNRRAEAAGALARNVSACAGMPLTRWTAALRNDVRAHWLGHADGGKALADLAELTSSGFTKEQADALQKAFGRKDAQGFDRTTTMWPTGGLTALGVAASGVIWAEIGSVRDELHEGIREDRAQIAELAKGQARIEAILEERLPRDT